MFITPGVCRGFKVVSGPKDPLPPVSNRVKLESEVDHYAPNYYLLPCTVLYTVLCTILCSLLCTLLFRLGRLHFEVRLSSFFSLGRLHFRLGRLHFLG